MDFTSVLKNRPMDSLDFSPFEMARDTTSTPATDHTSPSSRFIQLNTSQTRELCNMCLVSSPMFRQFTDTKSIQKIFSFGPEILNAALILLKSTIIDRKYGHQLTKLIKPLQNNAFNYRDSRFISAKYKPKPKLQEIINQIQHYTNYKQIIAPSDDKDMPVSLTPAIFSLKQNKFISEINGLLRANNSELYTLIGNIFRQFVPMFELCFGLELSNYSQLAVIVKIQDYQFDNVNRLKGKWHTEGGDNDNIIGVGAYYFDITENKDLYFSENVLEIAEKKISSKRKENIAKVDIAPNDCIVFKNSAQIQHRAVVSAEGTETYVAKSSNEGISRKFLTFFLLDPRKESQKSNANDMKWINYPWKVDVIIGYWTRGMNTPNEIMSLIGVFVFGNDEYLQGRMTEFLMSMETGNVITAPQDNPFYKKPMWRARARRRMN